MALTTLLALLLRVYRLAGPVLRWDEGWSLAHASLPWSELWRIAAEEWHPPAYVFLLRLWLVAGKDAWSIRYLSVLLGVLAVALAYRVARDWSGSARAGVLSALFAACWPLLVYYGQVARMYALAALAVLAAACFMLQDLRAGSWRSGLGLVASAAVALYSLYHTAWPIAAIWLYAALLRPRRTPRLLALGGLTLVAYLPWLAAARQTLAMRLAAGAGTDPVQATLGVLPAALEGLAFPYGALPRAGTALAVVLGLGLVAGFWNRSSLPPLLLPLLALGLSVAGTACSTRTYWFAVRHLVPATPFLGLALAWALDRLAARRWRLLPAALALLVAMYWPTSARFVYEKTLEVTDPFDPTEDYRYLSAHAGPDDLVYFNALARAGWYENLRRPQDARWSYAMRWDPIVEPLERIVARLEGRRGQYRALWFALYKGDFGPNAPLVGWLNANLYPAAGEWQGDMLYLAYVEPSREWQSQPCDARFGPGARLAEARWSREATPGGAIALELTWQADQPIAGGLKVFVHALDGSGRLIAQHDGIPAAGTRPTESWQPGEEIRDRHGLLLPAGLTGPGEVRLIVGLYDPQKGDRLRMPDGRDALELGRVPVRGAP
ncbi:MAG: glycosyltransferase family 39 protein [Anaerolineae bacterium]|nr:glycosyltransferase family 39 protein [Anaerolineae bacterium]